MLGILRLLQASVQHESCRLAEMLQDAMSWPIRPRTHEPLLRGTYRSSYAAIDQLQVVSEELRRRYTGFCDFNRKFGVEAGEWVLQVMRHRLSGAERDRIPAM